MKNSAISFDKLEPIMNGMKVALLALSLSVSLSACEATSSSNGAGPGSDVSADSFSDPYSHRAYWSDEKESWEENLITITMGNTTTYTSPLSYPLLPKEFNLAYMGIRGPSCTAEVVTASSEIKKINCEVDKEPAYLKVTGFEFVLAKTNPGKFVLNIHHAGHTYSISMEQVPYFVKTMSETLLFKTDFLGSDYRYLYSLNLKEIESYEGVFPTDQEATLTLNSEIYDSSLDLSSCSIRQTVAPETQELKFKVKVVTNTSPDIKKHWATLANSKLQTSSPNIKTARSVAEPHKLHVFTNDEKVKSVLSSEFSMPMRTTTFKSCGVSFDPEIGRSMPRSAQSNPYIGKRELSRNISIQLKDLVLKKASNQNTKTFGTPEVEIAVAKFSAPHSPGFVL
ncbi:MAG: hypothetical protein U1E10_10280 [Bdellovibrionales bacterium]|nr:hypothetical protein [Bdellovibrionales bacterium]